MKTFLSILLTFLSLANFAQVEREPLHMDVQEYENRIDEALRAIQIPVNAPADAVTLDENGTAQLWHIVEREEGVRVFTIEWYTGEGYYEEIFFELDGELVYVYAMERYNYIPAGHYIQITWYVEYTIKDGEILSHISLGHGKTEVEGWEPESIFEIYEERIRELEGLVRDMR
ncbi:MAG: hypothetical protein HWD92_02590 [Flavobacteriia bacterium]|nr:hypothetical protein [Flavobacteriia bacterium]